jgi:uncharacterized protein YecA (UPF0149 family)
MDTRDGTISSLEHFKKAPSDGEISQFIKPIDVANLSQKTRDLLAKTGTATISRNSRCPCGSGRRFKNCCMTK